MKQLLNVLGGLFAFFAFVVLAPFLILWFFVDLISIKFGGD